MRIFTPLSVLSFGKRILVALPILLLLFSFEGFAITKYWRGSTNIQTGRDWNTAANWSPSGVPGAGDDVEIGDAGMSSGRLGPIINDWNDYTVKTLKIGVDQTVELYMAPRSMRVAGNVTIGKYGILKNIGAQAYYSGSFLVDVGGQYIEEGFSENNGKGSGSKVWPFSEFLGSGVTIKGLTNAANSRSFGKIRITGSVTLEGNLTLTATDSYSAKNNKLVVSDSPELYVSGTLNPGDYQIKFVGSRVDAVFDVAQSAVIHVKKENFIDNYTATAPAEAMFPTLLNPLSIINYSGTINQNILPSRTYGVLTISGSGTKTLLAPEGGIETTIASNLFVTSATLDIAGYLLNRVAASTTGGTMNVANNATLKLSGASNFPINFTTVDLGSSSTVNYYGAAQNVTNVAKGYGNLYLTGSGIKTMPATTTLVIAGDLVGSGTVSFTAASNMNITGNAELNTNASFKGGSFIHTVAGNWINNADFTGETSTVILTGNGKTITRSQPTTSTLKNEFYNIELSGTGITTNVGTGNLTILGNFITSGAGTFTQGTGGLIMAGGVIGTPKTIAGTGITFNDLAINGHTSTTASFYVNGNFNTNTAASFTATGGVITFGNQNRTISYSITNSGGTQFAGLNIARTTTEQPINTSSSFFISSDLTGNNLEATAGTITFNGTSVFGGEHQLNNVTITGSLLKMATASVMSIKGVFTGAAANFDAQATNTVVYNGDAQTINNVTYYNITLSKSSTAAVTKTASGAFTALGDITINTDVTLIAGNYTHNIYGNWINSGTLTAGTGTFNFAGTANTSVQGITTFNIISINKGDVSNFITLTSNINTKDLYLTKGFMKTGANKVVVTGERYDNGWVEGTITRIKPLGFAATTEHLFNGPYVSINFGEINSIVTEISVTSTPAIVVFPGVVPVNRLYYVQANGSYKKAKVRLQYEDSELNGNTEVSDEEGLKLSYSNTYPNANWSAADKKLNNYTANWVEDNGITASNPDGFTDLNKYWALSDKPNRYFWKGTYNTAWEDNRNWDRYQVDGVTLEASPAAPTPSDIVELGTYAHTFDPVIGSEIYIKGLQFKASHNIELTISGTKYNPASTAAPALIVKGNLVPVDAASQAHTIITGAQKLEVRSTLQLDYDQHKINISKTAGELIINGTLSQSAASLSLGSGNLRLKGDYIKTGGTFSTTTGSVTYEGTNAQTIADVTYHHLVIDKTSGVALINISGSKIIGGDLAVKNGNMLLQSSTDGSNEITVNGSLSLGNSATTGGVTTTTLGNINATNTNINLKGNWVKVAGAFEPGTSTVSFVGNGSQSVSESKFNNLVFGNAAESVITATGNLTIEGDVSVQQGKVDLDTYSMNRSSNGGTLILAANTILELKGSDNFPGNFNTNTLDATSTVIYSGSNAQNVKALTYGALEFKNGNTTAKSLAGTTEVLSHLTIDANATLNGNGKVLRLSGDLNKNGNFIAGTNYTEGTLILAASSPIAERKLNGAIEVHNMLLEDKSDYVLTGSLTVKGDFENQGSIDGGTNRVTLEGNFLNTGVLISSGTAAFKGSRAQTIQLRAAISPGATGAPTVEFNGTVSPILNSTTAPAFGNVLITNTGGVTASVGWTVAGAFTVYPGATFNGGDYTHKFYSALINKGTFKSAGLLDFIPPYPLAPAPLAHPFELGIFESTGTLRLGGTGQILLAGTTPPVLNNLIIANTKGITTTTLNGAYPLGITNWTINGDLTIESSGALNAIPLVPAAGLLGTNFFIKENLVNNGAIVSKNPSNGAFFGIGANFTFTGTDSRITGTGTTMLGNLTINSGAALTIGKNLNIYTNLAHKGSSFTSGEYTVSFIGAGPSEITTEPATTLELSKIQVAKDAQATTVKLMTNVSKVLSMVVQRGTLDLGTSNVAAHPDVTETVEGVTTTTEVITTIAALDGATIKVGGTQTLPAADLISFAPTSTAEYYGASQQVKSVQYGNLTLKNTGLATFETGTALIAGSLLVQGETTQQVITPETVVFNGTGSQTVAPLAYQNLTLSNAGTKTFAAKFVTGANKVLSISGALTKAADVVVDADDTGVAVNYNGAAPQDVLPTNYYDLTLSNGSTKTFSGTTGVANAFTVLDGSSADLTSKETTIDFNGTGAQVLPGRLSYNKLLVSAGGAKTLSDDANIVKELRLTRGTIDTRGNKFTLEPTAEIFESEGNSVTGLVETKRTLTTATETFGKLGIEVTPSVSVGEVTVVRQTGAPIISPTSNNESILRNFTFTVPGESTNSNLNATIIFKYFDSELNALGEPTLRLYNLVQGISGGNEWVKQSITAPDTYINSLTATGVNSLTRMTLSSTVSPLPVELLSFTATKDGNNAVIEWATASELNNSGFEIQVSADGYTYQSLGFVKSKVGSSAIKQEYTFIDNRSSKSGLQYYRLKQIDFDGTAKLYGPKSINFGTVTAVSRAIAYPNPFTNELRVSIDTPENGAAKFKIYTTTGRLLNEDVVMLHAGKNDQPVDLTGSVYEPGLYLLVIELNGKQQTIKLIKE